MRDATYYESQASQLESGASAHASAARAVRRAGDEDSAMVLEQEASWARQVAGEMRAGPGGRLTVLAATLLGPAA